jgi:uncharacterized protein YfdQ (DUF2303 family)
MENEDAGLRGLAEFIADNAQPKSMILLTGDKAEGHRDVMAVPKGFHLQSVKPFLDEYLLTPERIRGTSAHTTLGSWLKHYAAFKDEGTAVFANGLMSDPKITAVYNYNLASDNPRFGDHRAVFNCTLSDEWNAWSRHGGSALSQHEFAAFIEDNIGDIQGKPDLTDEANAVLKDVSSMLGYAYAGQADMLQLSRGIEINESAKAKTGANLRSGERTLEYITEHKDGNGEKLAVPGLFLIAIPVFKDGVIYRLPVRLRYRLKDGTVLWSYDIYRDDKAFKDAYDEICAQIATQTGAAVFVGQPE